MIKSYQLNFHDKDKIIIKLFFHSIKHYHNFMGQKLIMCRSYTPLDKLLNP